MDTERTYTGSQFLWSRCPIPEDVGSECGSAQTECEAGQTLLLSSMIFIYFGVRNAAGRPAQKG